MNKKTALRVEDIMSRQLITLRETDTIAQAVREMSAAAIRHVPVVDAHNKLCGVVASYDLVGSWVDGPNTQLGRVMTTVVHTVGPHTPAYEAVGLLIDHKINALPVVDTHQEVIGIVTATDFLVVAHQALSGVEVSRQPAEV